MVMVLVLSLNTHFLGTRWTSGAALSFLTAIIVLSVGKSAPFSVPLGRSLVLLLGIILGAGTGTAAYYSNIYVSLLLVFIVNMLVLLCLEYGYNVLGAHKPVMLCLSLYHGFAHIVFASTEFENFNDQFVALESTLGYTTTGILIPLLFYWLLLTPKGISGSTLAPPAASAKQQPSTTYFYGDISLFRKLVVLLKEGTTLIRPSNASHRRMIWTAIRGSISITISCVPGLIGSFEKQKYTIWCFIGTQLTILAGTYSDIGFVDGVDRFLGNLVAGVLGLALNGILYFCGEK
eukprot:Awhi_evm1s1427